MRWVVWLTWLSLVVLVAGCRSTPKVPWVAEPPPSLRSYDRYDLEKQVLGRRARERETLCLLRDQSNHRLLVGVSSWYGGPERFNVFAEGDGEWIPLGMRSVEGEQGYLPSPADLATAMNLVDYSLCIGKAGGYPFVSRDGMTCWLGGEESSKVRAATRGASCEVTIPGRIVGASQLKGSLLLFRQEGTAVAYGHLAEPECFAPSASIDLRHVLPDLRSMHVADVSPDARFAVLWLYPDHRTSPWALYRSVVVLLDLEQQCVVGRLRKEDYIFLPD